MKKGLSLLALMLLSSCASLPDPPVVPEYHPASAKAPQAPMVHAFDILRVVPTTPPELPVPPPAEQPPNVLERAGDDRQHQHGSVEPEREHPTHEAPAAPDSASHERHASPDHEMPER